MSNKSNWLLNKSTIDDIYYDDTFVEYVPIGGLYNLGNDNSWRRLNAYLRLPVFFITLSKRRPVLRIHWRALVKQLSCIPSLLKNIKKEVETRENLRLWDETNHGWYYQQTCLYYTLHIIEKLCNCRYCRISNNISQLFKQN